MTYLLLDITRTVFVSDLMIYCSSHDLISLMFKTDCCYFIHNCGGHLTKGILIFVVTPCHYHTVFSLCGIYEQVYQYYVKV